MSLGDLVDKILVYQSCSYGFDPSYGTSFFFFFLFFFLTTPIRIYAYLACKGSRATYISDLLPYVFRTKKCSKLTGGQIQKRPSTEKVSTASKKSRNPEDAKNKNCLQVTGCFDEPKQDCN